MKVSSVCISLIKGFFPESISKDLASVDPEAAPWCLIFFNAKEKCCQFVFLCKLCVHVESVLHTYSSNFCYWYLNHLTRWDPNHQNFVDHQIFFNEISAVSYFIFTFCWENKFLIGQSTKIFSLKTGIEELKKKVNKIWLKKYLVITKFWWLGSHEWVNTSCIMFNFEFQRASSHGLRLNVFVLFFPPTKKERFPNSFSTMS